MRRVGGAEAVDRLHVVTDDGHVFVLAAEGAYDLDLERVDVLVLVDEHVLVPSGDPAP